MNDSAQRAGACQCTNCPGAGCTCGYQTQNTAVLAAPAACRCGPACGCEAAEQGCVCR